MAVSDVLIKEQDQRQQMGIPLDGAPPTPTYNHGMGMGMEVDMYGLPSLGGGFVPGMNIPGMAGMGERLPNVNAELDQVVAAMKCLGSVYPLAGLQVQKVEQGRLDNVF
jgi:hypothetical protein